MNLAPHTIAAQQALDGVKKLAAFPTLTINQKDELRALAAEISNAAYAMFEAAKQ